MPHVEMFENWLNSCLIAHFQVSAFFLSLLPFSNKSNGDLIIQVLYWNTMYIRTGIAEDLRVCTYGHCFLGEFHILKYVPTSDQLSLPKLIQTMAKLFPQNVQTLEINTMALWLSKQTSTFIFITKTT